MTLRWDAIVVGGGQNGLICAAYLARAGRRVLVLGEEPETDPLTALRPWIWRDLRLAKHGLRVAPLTGRFAPAVHGQGLCLWANADRSYDEIARHNRRDAQRYTEHGQALDRLARRVQDWLAKPPLDPSSLAPRDLRELWNRGAAVRALGSSLAPLFLELQTLSVMDLLDRWFVSEPLKALLASSAVFGTTQSVYAPGTAWRLLGQRGALQEGHGQRLALAVGGPGAVTGALVASARSFGATFQRSQVDHVAMRGRRAVAVVLKNGDKLEAKSVVSGRGPRSTFQGLLKQVSLPDSLTAQLDATPSRAAMTQLTLRVDGVPLFQGRPEFGPHLRSQIVVGPTLAFLEAASLQAQSGATVPHPPLQVVLSTQLAPWGHPPGQSQLSVRVQGAAGGALADRVIHTLDHFSPGLKERLLQCDWEHASSVFTEVNTAYRTPFRALWLCGEHTYASRTGAPGALCAQAMLQRGAV